MSQSAIAPDSQATAFRLCVVAPTFNNAATLLDILRRIAAQNFPLIVVNDGSTDDTRELLAQWQTQHPQTIVLTHPRNRGKSAALHTAFDHARTHGFSHALTIDTDGQLDPEQIPQLAALAQAHPAALVIGTRDITRPDYPAKSRLGRRVSGLLIWIETGIDVDDSQCGFRVYPLTLIHRTPCAAGRFGFESEIIVRALWTRTPIVQSPVNCRYFSGEKRVTHFKPLRDSIRVLLMHGWLLFIAIMPWSPGAGPVISMSDLKPKPDGGPLRRAWNWVSPLRLWRDVRDHNQGPAKTALALAVGAYIGNIPPWGVQTAIGLYVARRWHLHPLAVVLGTHIAFPPVGFALVFAAVWIGHLLTHGQFLSAEDFSPSMVRWDELTLRFLADWVVGSIPVGMLCAVIVFFVSMFVLRKTASHSQQIPQRNDI